MVFWAEKKNLCLSPRGDKELQVATLVLDTGISNYLVDDGHMNLFTFWHSQEGACMWWLQLHGISIWYLHEVAAQPTTRELLDHTGSPRMSVLCYIAWYISVAKW